VGDVELGDPAPDRVELGVVELAGVGLVSRGVGLVGGGVRDPEGVTVNCSMAMGALPSAAG
jgi:hypothetical protein